MAVKGVKTVKRSVGKGLVKNNRKAYTSYRIMLQKCYDKKSSGYKYCGGRGIIVCARWKNYMGFNYFLEDMGNSPSNKHVLGRVDKKSNYEINNCRWMTMKETGFNRINTVYVVYKGDKMRLNDLVEANDMHFDTVKSRIDRGFTVEQSIGEKGVLLRGFSNYVGKKYGRLTITGFDRQKRNSGIDIVFMCICECGKEITVKKSHVLQKRTRSCGCLRREMMRERGDIKTHGHSGDMTYLAWISVKQYSKKRGLYLQESWKGFAKFLADMGEKPDKSYNLKRIDKSKGYDNANCEWVKIK